MASADFSTVEFCAAGELLPFYITWPGWTHLDLHVAAANCDCQPAALRLNTASVTVLPIQVPSLVRMKVQCRRSLHFKQGWPFGIRLRFDLSMPMRLTAPLGWIWEPAVVASGFWQELRVASSGFCTGAEPWDSVQDAAFGSTAALPGRAA